MLLMALTIKQKFIDEIANIHALKQGGCYDKFEFNGENRRSYVFFYENSYTYYFCIL